MLFISALNFASDKVISKVSEELESSGKLEDIKEAVKSDPEIAGFIKEVEADPEANQFLNKNETAPLNKAELPIQTKEEAVMAVVDRVGISEVTKMVKGFQDGTVSKQEVIQEVSTQFTEEELMALKIIAYKELYEQ